MTRGILYWYCGPKSLLQLAVSLWTLRAHWSGPVTICCDGPRCLDDVERLARAFDAEALELRDPNGCRTARHWHYVAKTILPDCYERTIYLDADTTVHADPSPLFTDSARGLTVTRFARWVTTGRRIRGRLTRLAMELSGSEWEGLAELVSRSEYPAINTGVMAWGDQTDRWIWQEMAVAGYRAPLTDEIALQAALPKMRCWNVVEVVDDAWNWSPTYGVSAAPKIVHYHGRRHVRKPEGQKRWGPIAAECLAALPASIFDRCAMADPAAIRVARG